MTPDAVDLFGGPGGWAEGCAQLGVLEEGVELEPNACATRRARGHRVLQADVSKVAPEDYDGADGVIGSPPCPTFSGAGKGAGHRDLPKVWRVTRDIADGEDSRGRYEWEDERSVLVVEPLRWVRVLQPRWIALEQVPPVLPYWHALASIFQGWDYSTWTGILDAADFGVPQSRKRAILIAKRNGSVHPPARTHARGGSVASFFDDGLPDWRTMEEGVGWGFTDRPALTLTAGGSRTGGWHPFDGGSGARDAIRLARAEGRWINRPGTDEETPDWTASKAPIADAGVLQSFPMNYPWQGSEYDAAEQIGNAVPPALARAVLEAVV